MSSNVIPLKVLTEQVAEAIDGRQVKTAVFTTFSFDPGFFELHILPVLFDRPFSQPEKVRRLQLEDALGTIDHLAVYYDRRALAQDGEPAQLDYRRLDVSRRTGYFHPKVILILVQERNGDGNASGRNRDGSASTQMALIVGVLSANLTRSGWWENVECAHIEEIKDRSVDGKPCSFRSDLLSIIRRIRYSASDTDDQSALEGIRNFLLQRTQRSHVARRHSKYRHYTRMFAGQSRESLSTWLRKFSLDKYELNLEVISPFFDSRGEGPLRELIGTIRPKEIRIFHPSDSDGASLVTRDTYEAIRSLDSTRWARFPGEVVSRGRDHLSERLLPRRVHAKVYRFWKRDGPDLLLVGSPNLTRAGHSHGSAGNLEAAFLVDFSHAQYHRRWWLEPLDRDADRFVASTRNEEDGCDVVGLNLSLRFDWGTKELSYRLEDHAAEGFTIQTTAGETFGTISHPVHGRWTAFAKGISDRLERLLHSTSFLVVRYGVNSWRVLIREENMGHRPSLLLELTPAEILEYWALLTPTQRAQFIETNIRDQVEGLAISRVDRHRTRDTLFDRFAGVFHGFGCLERSIDDALEEGHENVAEARLFGAKYDSLPNLLTKILKRPERDPILAYVTLLCATQLRRKLGRQHGEFFGRRVLHVKRLDELLNQLPHLRSMLDLRDPEAGDFLKWYEESFLRPVTQARRWR